MNKADHHSERAKARWAILRNALLSNSNNRNKNKNNNNSSTIESFRDNTANDNDSQCISTENNANTSTSILIKEHSIHRFSGFQMLKRQTINVKSSLDAILSKGYKLAANVESPDSSSNSNEIAEYEIPFEVSALNFPRNNDGGYCATRNYHGDSSNINSSGNNAVTIRTLERKNIKTKLSMKELMSHVHYGVDNTGNTRVWDCSNVLAFLILGEKAIPRENLSITSNTSSHNNDNSKDDHLEYVYSKNEPFIGLSDILSLAKDNYSAHCVHERKLLRVLELGAGMAALPSLALAALYMQYKSRNNEGTENGQKTSIPRIHVTITDGHPNAVENNIASARLTQELYDCRGSDDGKNISCHPLLWKANAIGKQECDELMKNMSRNDVNACPSSSNHNHSEKIPFDLMLVSDCTHFTDFHIDMAATIGRMLRINGICLLCQPQRGESLKKFIQVIDAMNSNSNAKKGPLFQVDLHQVYNEEIYTRHESLLGEKSEQYDANIHYPLLLVLKKLREYYEDEDTETATMLIQKQSY
jgi:hypothetical protein